MIDLRSDTVTQPTDAMRRAIAEAPVGDDVFHDDPSVLELEETVAELLGMDEAMYVPSGTMSNQTAIKVHTKPGDVVLAADHAHIHIHELGAPYVLSGVTIQFLASENGNFTGDVMRRAVPVIPDSMPSSLFQPVTMVAVENTHNAAGGVPWPMERLRDVVAAADDVAIAKHMDGARLWNAAVALDTTEASLVDGFDTVSVCFSKGLGAPMGSALVGRKDFITQARRYKQMFGGGFRQAGMMAAGALYAVRHHRERLVQDHENATRLAMGLAETPGIEVESSATNMVYFKVRNGSAQSFEARCAATGVALIAMDDITVRVVCNLGVSTQDVDDAVEIIGEAING